MEILRELSALTGVPISTSGNASAESRQIFSVTGIRIKPATLLSLKRGDRSGLETVDRFLAWKVLQDDDASRKNELYLRLLRGSTGLRDHHIKPENEHRFQSDGFTTAVGNTLGLDDQVVRYSIRAMRYEMVYADQTSSDYREPAWFTGVVNRYFSDYLSKGTKIRSTSIDEIARLWSPKSRYPVAQFYELMYQFMGGRTIGTWTTYEVDALLKFYERQVKQGNYLTLFDEDVLISYRDDEPAGDLRTRIIDIIGLTCDKTAVQVHRNALLHSQTRNPDDHRWATRRG